MHDPKQILISREVRPNPIDPLMFGDANAYLFERPPYPEIPSDYFPPNVHLQVFLSEHGTEQDFAPAVGAIKAADIIIPEEAGWTKASLSNWNRLVKGDKKVAETWLRSAALDPVTGGYKTALYTTVHNEGIAAYRRGQAKTVLLIDMTADETAKLDTAYELDAGANVDEMLYNYGLTIAKITYEGVARNHTMLERLGPEVSRTVSRHPKLRDRERVESVFVGGIMHAGVFRHLQSNSDIADRVGLNTREPEGEDQYLHVTRIKQAFEELRQPTRKEMLDCVTLMAIHGLGLPTSVTYAMHELMVADADSPELSYAMLSKKLRQGDTESITDYIQRAEAVTAERQMLSSS